jgi:hypothetical protein
VFGQRPFAHVGDRLIIDHVIAVTGAQQFEEVEAARAGPARVSMLVRLSAKRLRLARN